MILCHQLLMSINSIYYILQGIFMESGKDSATFRRPVGLCLFQIVGRLIMSTGWGENLIMPMVEQNTALQTYHITKGGTTRGAQRKSTFYARNQSEHNVQNCVVDNVLRHVSNWGIKISNNVLILLPLTKYRQTY